MRVLEKRSTHEILEADFDRSNKIQKVDVLSLFFCHKLRQLLAREVRVRVYEVRVRVRVRV